MAVAGAIFLTMIFVTVQTSLQQSLWSAWPAYSANPWATATLWDAYCGFTLFWIWVAYRERSWFARIVWLILIFALGNIATAGYLLLALSQLSDDEPAEAVLRRKPA